MHITKKIDRAFQWAGEKMGSEAKTAMSEDFKMLELEMALRFDGTWCPGVSSRPILLQLANGKLSLFRHGPSAKVHERIRQVAGPPRRDV